MRDAVLILSFGGPEKPEDIRPFLEIVTRGRRIPPERITEVAHHYERIGGRSPINAITNRQAEGLRAALLKSDTPWPVYVGNRNWNPFIEETLREMAADGIERAIGFPTAAYRSEASLERYVNAAEEARRTIGSSAPKIDYVGPWFDHPLFIEAIASRIHEVLNTSKVKIKEDSPWVFTAHSIPSAMADASTYVEDLGKTAELVAKRFQKRKWSLAYTSRSGNPKDPWLEPDICDVIRGLGKKGVGQLVAIPIGFLADHVEVLYDLDVEAQEAASAAGVELVRAQTVGDHPKFVQMICEVVRERATRQARPEDTRSASC